MTATNPLTLPEFVALIKGAGEDGRIAARFDRLFGSDRKPSTLRGRVAAAFNTTSLRGYFGPRIDFRIGPSTTGGVYAPQLEAVLAVINAADWLPPGVARGPRSILLTTDQVVEAVRAAAFDSVALKVEAAFGQKGKKAWANARSSGRAYDVGASTDRPLFQAEVNAIIEAVGLVAPPAAPPAAPAVPWTPALVLARLVSIAGSVPLDEIDPQAHRSALRLAFPSCGDQAIETWRGTQGDGERHVLRDTRQQVGFRDSELNAIARLLNDCRVPVDGSPPTPAPSPEADLEAAWAGAQAAVFSAFDDAVKRAPAFDVDPLGTPEKAARVRALARDLYTNHRLGVEDAGGSVKPVVWDGSGDDANEAAKAGWVRAAVFALAYLRLGGGP